MENVSNLLGRDMTEIRNFVLKDILFGSCQHQRSKETRNNLAGYTWNLPVETEVFFLFLIIEGQMSNRGPKSAIWPSINSYGKCDAFGSRCLYCSFEGVPPPGHGCSLGMLQR